MSILVVGSIALDDVETPYGKANDSIGGSALYFGAAASSFSPVNVVGVIGEDFNLDNLTFLKARNVDLSGTSVEKGKTFRWGGRYHLNVNKRDTLYTELNVFENFKPTIPDHYRNDPFIFLANIDPELQLDVLNQMDKPRLSVLDTMNFWINRKKDALMALVKKVDVMILNDEELFELTEVHNIYRAANILLKEGLRALVVKKGEHGALLVDNDGYFIVPAFPVEKVVDPTGAGDSFAGGFLGYLSTCDEINDQNLRKAIVYGTVVASFTVEDFSYNRLKNIQRGDLEKRIEHIRDMTTF